MRTHFDRAALWFAAVGVAAMLTGCTSDGPLITISRNSPDATAVQATAPPLTAAPINATAVPATPVAATTVPATPIPTPAPTPTPLPTSAPVRATPDPSADGFPGWLRVNGFGPVDFGSSTALARLWVAPRFGEPASAFDNPECGLTVLSWSDFSLAFENGGLVGWFYRSSSPSLQSPSGVAPGITTNDLRTAYQGVEIYESTLGREFLFEVPAGFMGGFFGNSGDRVTEMFAGQNCFFR